MSTNSFKFRLLGVTLAGKPLICEPSIVRLAASAYRPDRTVVSRAEIDRRLSLDGEVTYLRAGHNFYVVEPPEFDRFRSDMLVQIAKAFGGAKR